MSLECRKKRPRDDVESTEHSSTSLPPSHNTTPQLSVVADRLRFEGDKRHLIGKGTFGFVFKAVINGLACAVKQISVDDSNRVLVDNELSALKILSKHPNIATMLDASFNSDNNAYIVFPLASMDMYTYIRMDRGTSQVCLSIIESFVSQIVSGLYWCHINGIVHGDLKTGNILVYENGLVQIADFGSCRRTGFSVKSGPSNGTICYSAPESFIVGSVYQPSSDVWSLGCCIYELVATRLFVSIVDDFEKIMYINDVSKLEPKKRLELLTEKTVIKSYDHLMTDIFTECEKRITMKDIVRRLKIRVETLRGEDVCHLKKDVSEL